ncbi:Tat pathway signal sequence domain protein [Kibdelosporangium aridum]|uniref:Tat pathway signal sequence domain protein n=2 Tax=Kibdelosporangium aridum TaxID=2030 RepID=A0A428XX93_KIBAR|nr:Tat pathway signal sequence domain protein [Kibdelosporangium aridum]
MPEWQWAEFLGRQDLIWQKLPAEWYEGPFLGDGRLGSIVRREPGRNAIRFSVQHAEVQDHRPAFGSGWGVCRLPVGHLTLEPLGTITGVDWRLDLWNAELRGTVSTTSGSLQFRAFIHTSRSVLVATVKATGTERVRWEFHPAEAISPRATIEAAPAGYERNPAFSTRTEGAETIVVQPLAGGGQTATAYAQSSVRGEHTLLLSVAHSFPGINAEGLALDAVRQAEAAGVASLAGTHRSWWHDFYQRSFVSIPDQRLQSFHWVQLYKAASGTRAGGTVMATCGPWLESTPWPAVWWNLNIQLEYWLIHGSNHLELDALSSTLRDNVQQMISNVRPQYQGDSAGVGRSTDRTGLKGNFLGRPGDGAEVGNLPWALHNAWLSYRHTMDDTLLRDTVFPLLRRAINYYLRFLKPDIDGKLHLPSTLSPEYGAAPDCNFDLALIRWGCQALLDAADRLKIDDPLIPRWQEVLRDLTPYPVDDTGLMIGAGVPYAKSHRHYSHLLMIYPLYLMNWDQPENRELIEKSLRHWHSLQGAHRGYSYTGAASILAMMGRGDEALEYLLKFFDTSTRFPVKPNTMYAEAGPVVETPLSASQSLLDMLCQSWGGVIRVFPAVPTAWRDVTLDKFLAQGAFAVSAARKGRQTRWISVHSLAGEQLRVKPGIGGSLVVSMPGGRRLPWRWIDGEVIEIDLAKGGTAVIYPGGRLPNRIIEPVPISIPGRRWGLTEEVS